MRGDATLELLFRLRGEMLSVIRLGRRGWRQALWYSGSARPPEAWPPAAHAPAQSHNLTHTQQPSADTHCGMSEVTRDVTPPLATSWTSRWGKPATTRPPAIAGTRMCWARGGSGPPLLFTGRKGVSRAEQLEQGPPDSSLGGAQGGGLSRKATPHTVCAKKSAPWPTTLRLALQPPTTTTIRKKSTGPAPVPERTGEESPTACWCSRRPGAGPGSQGPRGPARPSPGDRAAAREGQPGSGRVESQQRILKEQM